MFTNFTNSHRFTEDPTDWFYIEGCFSKKEIEKILKHISQSPMLLGTTETDETEERTYRKNRSRWIPGDKDSEWIYDRILGYVDHVNNKHWKFDLFDVKEPIQYVEYSERDHYDWHIDVGPGEPFNQRKVSICIQLSEETDYEGGDLEILRNRDAEIGIKKQGSIILYPSFLLNRITPVTKGVRKSLLLWVGRGSFK